MGVPGLWPILDKHAESTTLLEAALSLGFTPNAGGQRALRLGVDASIWLRQALASKYNVYRGGSKEVLRSLYRHCGRLFQLPIIPLFIFDGPDRAPMKRDRAVKTQLLPHELAFRQLLEHLGFRWKMAAGEAEAELAALSRAGLIDAVLSTDVDCLVFGATRVFRITDIDYRTSRVRISSYSASTLEENNLSRANLTLIALMSGGDYHHGITNCGISTAVELTRTNLGPRLIDAMRNLRPKELSEFLIQWRRQLCTLLRDNPNHVLSQRHPAIAAAIPTNFPNPKIIHLYLNPKISPFSSSDSLEWNAPSIPQLSVFLDQHFQWGWPGVLEDFRTHIFAGLALRELLRDILVDDGEVIESGFAPYSLITRRNEKRRCPRSELEMRVLLTIRADLVDVVESSRVKLLSLSAVERFNRSWRGENPQTHIAWLPRAVFEASPMNE
ncbi:PIN domain-like protein [Hymenopellis radicata]|nr:PIN domain-like protein [Hymenopellis radicata]